jgi:hypothetical protein
MLKHRLVTYLRVKSPAKITNDAMSFPSVDQSLATTRITWQWPQNTEYQPLASIRYPAKMTESLISQRYHNITAISDLSQLISLPPISLQLHRASFYAAFTHTTNSPTKRVTTIMLAEAGLFRHLPPTYRADAEYI